VRREWVIFQQQSEMLGTQELSGHARLLWASDLDKPDSLESTGE
jgi:hypothetical protein